MTDATAVVLADALRDRYQLERELGRGGMATVYLGRDLKHGRMVALKVLDRDISALLGPERFRREIQTAARLHHPHILQVHDSGEAAGLLYYVMPHVEGESLRERLRHDGRLAVPECLQITGEVADALDYAHRHGLVHRDVKPENILLSEGHALLADFGIAKPIDAATGPGLTQTGLLVGTPAYMSPEQAAGGTIDGRSDQYALACVVYEMLAGQPPFTGPTPQAVIAQRFREAGPTFEGLPKSVPAGVRHALRKALSPEPESRFATAREFASALEPNGGEALAQARPPGPSGQSRYPKHWRLSTPVGLLVLLAAAAGAVLWAGRGPASVGERNMLAVRPSRT